MYTILFSSPKSKSRFLKPKSVSIRTTLYPAFASAVPMFALVVVFPTPPFPDVITISYRNLVILGIITSLAAIIGDLIESVFKRSCEVKDSGNLIPGRGGVLDSIDSILIAAPIFYIGYNFLFL